LSDMFSIRNGLKQGDVFLPLLFNFAFDSAKRRIHLNRDGFKLSGTHQRLVCVDDVNICIGGSMHTIEKNTEALVVTSNKIGLEVNADTTKYMVTSRDKNAGQSHNM